MLHFNYDNAEEDNVIDGLENSEDEIIMSCQMFDAVMPTITKLK